MKPQHDWRQSPRLVQEWYRRGGFVQPDIGRAA